MNTYTKILIIVGLLVGFSTITSAARVTVNPVSVSDGSVYPRTSTDTLGSFLNIWPATYTTALYASTTNAATTTTSRLTNGVTPIIATSTGSGSTMGTSTVATGSSGLGGSVYLVTGSNPAGDATIFSLTSSSTNPFCTVSPANSLTAQLSTASSTFVATSTNGFLLKSSTNGLSATTTYQWNYHCY